LLRGMEMVANTDGSKGREVHQAQPKTLFLSIFYVHLSYWSLSESLLSLPIQVIPEVPWYTRYFLVLWRQTGGKTSPSPGGLFSFSSSPHVYLSFGISVFLLVNGSKTNHKVATICHASVLSFFCSSVLHTIPTRPQSLVPT